MAPEALDRPLRSGSTDEFRSGRLTYLSGASALRATARGGHVRSGRSLQTGDRKSASRRWLKVRNGAIRSPRPTGAIDRFPPSADNWYLPDNPPVHAGLASPPEASPEVARRHRLQRPELAVEIGDVLVADLVCDMGDRPVAVDQQRAGLADAQLRHVA